jgi:lipopolysaccharide transport system ATP-binding protein
MSSIISVSNLSKAYRIGKKAERADSFVGMLQDSVTAPFRNWRRMRQPTGESRESEEELHWALRDVSFEVQEGEVLGVIGRNGAGKSTLLKILSRITEPTNGEVKIRGRVASLLEVGTGFHPELTGRENVYLNGTILGMHKAEIDKKFEEIVDFSGVEKFLDTPVKRYSSGMKVRLAFAVAAHLDPEIMIVDEVLAVGDAEFQKKCLGKMRKVSSDGNRTVLFVSHNMPAVQSLCTSALLIEQGRLVVSGEVSDVVDRYIQMASRKRLDVWTRENCEASPEAISIEKVEVSLAGDQPNVFLKLFVSLQSSRWHPAAFLAVDIHNPQGDWLMQAIPETKPFINADCPDHRFHIHIELPPLIPGPYPISVWVGSTFSETLDWAREIVQFQIHDSPTIGRTVPHSRDRGFCVPKSRVERLEDSAT